MVPMYTACTVFFFFVVNFSALLENEYAEQARYIIHYVHWLKWTVAGCG